MIGVHVTVPVACFRKGLAREYLETESVPPPATCYGFLLSLVGETDRKRHCGARVTPALIGQPPVSVVLRTVWRVKKAPLGSPGNTRPDYQQLLTGIELVIWLDSSEETATPTLEQRVQTALDPARRAGVSRFGGLSLGESTHLVDVVELLTDDRRSRLEAGGAKAQTYLLAEQGLLGLPVWVDHVGSAGTVHVVGELVEATDLSPPPKDRIPRIVQADSVAGA
jgi:CRISPR-associated protein Cas5t